MFVIGLVVLFFALKVMPPNIMLILAGIIYLVGSITAYFLVSWWVLGIAFATVMGILKFGK
ncbi:MAG: hypothetical protein OHK0057_27580 [Thermoflexibacter sp.]